MAEGKKKNAPLPASSAGLLRFFEDETKGFKIDPKIVISMPISIIAVSWVIDLLLIPQMSCQIPMIFKTFTSGIRLLCLIHHHSTFH